MLGSTYASAKLVKLRQAKTLGMLDDHDGSLGDIDADFDHGRSDKHFQLARRERAHHAVFVFGLQASVDEADDVGAKKLREKLGARGCSRKVNRFGFFDQWAYPINLRALGDLALDAADDVFQFGNVDQAGGDRLPPRRFVGQARDIHIAIGSQG